MASDDRDPRPWWRPADPDLDRALAVVADQIVDATAARRHRPRVPPAQETARARRPAVDVRAVVAHVACTLRRSDHEPDPVEVVGDLRLDTDEAALRDLLAHLVAAGVARARRVHVSLGPRTIVVTDHPPAGPPPSVRPGADTGARPTGAGAGDLELVRFARRLQATVDVGRGDGTVRTAVTLPSWSVVRAG